MNITILTFEGFNELDSLIAFGILSRIKKDDWKVTLASNQSSVTSMNGLTVNIESSLEDVSKADVVIVGSGMKTRDIINDDEIMSSLKLDLSRQIIVSQCSGALILAKLGILGSIPACTDLTSKPWVQETGVEVLNQAFYAKDNIATSGGCLASVYLSAWVIAKTLGIEEAKEQIYYFAPVGEKELYISQTIENITPYL